MRHDVAPTITTARLILRACEVSDFEDYAAMWADPRVTDFIGGTPRLRGESWRRFCVGTGLWPLHGYGYWLFVERDTNKMVGIGGLAAFERGLAELDNFPEAGWAFAADSWGKGYAREAVAAFLAWSDSTLGVAETRCIISPGNAASIQVAKKCGFSELGQVSFEGIATIVYSRRSLHI